MENEIKVGEYVRTKTGYITMFLGKDEESGYYILQDTIENSYGARLNYIDKFEIKSHKLNLIDIIEEGDYVNGHKVIDASDTNKGCMREVYCEDDEDFGIWDEMIETVVTKEQFENISYKVKE